MKGGNIPVVVGLMALTGCLTFNETEIPQIAISALPADRAVRLQVAGYDALITTYVPVYGYSTVVAGDAWYGPHWGYYGRPYATTVATETLVPQASTTAVFRDRATETLEKCGYLLKTNDPQYRLEVTFGGPYVSDGDSWKAVAWNVLTILTADYGTQTWVAKLKIYDVKTGKLLFLRDYEQRYQVNVWGPIPIFSPGACDKTKYSAMQSWCLTTLTDQTLRDTTDFLSKQPK